MSLITRCLGIVSLCLLLTAGRLVSAEETLNDSAAPCGKNFTTGSGSGNVTGSGFTHCTWQIMLNNNKQKSIVFQQLVLQNGDYIVVYDGKEDKNGTNLVANITGQQDAFLVVGFSKNIIIELYHNSTANISVYFDYNSTGCLVSFVPTYARTVTSPVYLPGKGDVVCQYKMLGLPQNKDKAAALAFTQFNIVTGQVTVSDGVQTVVTNGSANARLPDDFISNLTKSLSVEITMNFTLKKSSAAQTFDTFFSTVDQRCSQVLNVADNTTVTVDIPAGQSPLTDCRIILRAQPGNTLLLNMTTLKLLSGSDKVTVTDGGSLGSRTIPQLSSLPQEGSIVTSSGRELWLRLVVGELPGERIFSVDVFEQKYGGRYYQSGNISVEVNATEASYYYQFIAQEGQQVSVTLGQNADLFPKASLDFYDGTQPNSKLLMSFKTGTQFFPVTSSSSNMLLIARNFNGPQNFSAHFQSVDQSCSSLASGPDGKFTLKLAAMPQNLCRWTIRPQNSKGYVVLNVDSLMLGDNETVTIYSGVIEYGLTIATFDISSVGKALPSISSPVGQGLELVYRSNNTCKNCTAPVVKASYKVTQQDCGGILKSSTGTLTSPNYPNLYSLNTDCIWYATNSSTNETSKQQFFMSFADLQLDQGHMVKVKHSLATTAQYGGMTLPNDLIVPADKASVEFTSQPTNRSASVTTGRGFKASYWKLDCGGNFTTTNYTGSFSTTGYPGPVKETTLCVWIISLPFTEESNTTLEEGKTSLRTAVQFQIVLLNKDKKKPGPVTVHDGGSVRNTVLHFNDTMGKKGVIARTNTIVVIYNYTATAGEDGTGPGMSLNFSAFTCNESMQCGGDGICIHPDWICNGVDDCGDMTDEKMNCSGYHPGPKPTPTPSKGSSGLVKSYWIAVCLLLGLLFGAVLAFLIPAIYRRIKYPHYDQLRDLSAPVVT